MCVFVSADLDLIITITLSQIFANQKPKGDLRDVKQEKILQMCETICIKLNELDSPYCCYTVLHWAESSLILLCVIQVFL